MPRRNANENAVNRNVVRPRDCPNPKHRRTSTEQHDTQERTVALLDSLVIHCSCCFLGFSSPNKRSSQLMTKREREIIRPLLFQISIPSDHGRSNDRQRKREREREIVFSAFDSAVVKIVRIWILAEIFTLSKLVGCSAGPVPCEWRAIF